MRDRADDLERFGQSFAPVRPATPLDELTDAAGISVSELRRRAAVIERYPFDWLQFAEQDPETPPPD